MSVLRRVSLSKPSGEAGKSWPGIAIGFFVAFGGVLFGYDTGTISGILAMPYWQTEFSTGYINPKGHLDVTTNQESAIVSILSAGTFFGALASPFLGDYIGRRLALIISTWVFNLGVALQAASTAIPLFLAGRFFAGLGVGLICPGPSVPVRDGTQVDSRRHCWRLPVCHHHWFAPRRHCQQCYIQPK